MNENQIRELFRRNILEKVQEAFQVYLDENAVPKKLVSHQDTTFQITEEQVDLAFEDFMEQLDENPEAEVQDQLKEYVNEQYDIDFFIVKIEEKLDVEQMQEELREELLLLLSNTEPYSVVPREYWYRQALKVQNIEELAKYTAEENLEIFTDKYAPEWEEVEKENRD